MGHLICSVRKRYPLLGSTAFILCTLYLLLIWPPHTAVAAVADTGCKFTKAGTSYSGSLTRTVGGITCQRWDSQTPHAHSYLSDSLFPDETKSDAANYCRNPDDQEPNGPWCYTMDQNTRWQYCDIPMCECRTTTGGHSYAGTLSTTQTGKRCQRWDSQVPHGHSYLDPTWFPEGNVSLANNYCRNPDGQWQAGLWCYTTDPNVRWETCDVPMCECKTTPDGMTYMGRIAQTTAGQTCQRWDSQTPHEHSYTDGSMYPDGNVSFAQNYCRNPDDNEPGGPWCYTTSSSPRWGYCTVPLCELHLRITTTVSTPTATPFTGPTPTVGWATERPDVDHQECKFNTKGTSYRGTQMRTVTGKTCQRWDTQSPHTHSYTDPAWFPDQLLLNASNYCRNPQGHEPTGPWCYTTDPNSRWELCSIQLCDCRQTRAGTEYMGHTTVTSGGIQCQRWDQMAPHRHSYTDPSMFPDNTLADAVNYCRNPERNEPNGPWCYTTDPRIRWQYCNITYCDCKVDNYGLTYQATKTKTAYGLTCQRWDSNTPQQHGYLDNSMFPDVTVSDASNYCRNPDDQEPNGPWCYTMNPVVRWQYCDVLLCDMQWAVTTDTPTSTPLPNTVSVSVSVSVQRDCKQTQGGQEYAGTVTVTREGSTCQRWDSQTPHSHSYYDPSTFPDNTVADAANYCRNPDVEEPGGPWCYTTNPNIRWQYCDIPQCDCKRTIAGTEYAGKIAKSVTNRVCQRWDSQTPHSHSYYDPNMFPEANVADASNYCRNPDKEEPGGPWCYTTDTNVRWEYCTIPFCDCKVDQAGVDYGGTRAKTINGKTCQRWDSQTPHTHSYTDPSMYPDGTLSDAQNYCRNPDVHEPDGPWCYTTDANTRWEYCGVPLCSPLTSTMSPVTATPRPTQGPNECRTNDTGEGYMGKLSHTVNFKSCQAWSSNTPHNHKQYQDSDFPDGTVARAGSFCRNPSGEKPNGPWCYTKDPSVEWEYCSVPRCGCRKNKGGWGYNDTLAHSKTGKACQRWDSQSPHTHSYYDPSMFPDSSVSAAENFCRNPDRWEPEGPWCYTMDSNTRWEYCTVPFCECKLTDGGHEYGGKTSKTASGRTCQRWDQQAPHTHRYYDVCSFPEAKIEDASNYCRNPEQNEHSGPWCYTTDSQKRWEYCNIPKCPAGGFLPTSNPLPTAGRQISGESLSTGGIVGICLAIILVMTVAFVGFYMYRRYRWKPSLTDSDAVNGTNKSFDNPIYGTGIHFTGDKVVLCDDGPKSQDKA